MPRFSDLFSPLGGDFRRLLAKDSLAIMQLGAFGAATAARYDRRVAGARWGQGDLHEALEPGATVGGMIAQSGAAFATYAIGRAVGKPRLARLGADLVRAQIVTQGVTQTVKFATQRTRPDGSILSFPSGHTSTSFATATVLNAHFGLKAGIPAYAMAAWVAASRVQMKRHHVSDVVAGATVGLLAGRAVTFGHGRNRFALSPMVVPGGAGVSIASVDARR
jgi:membrane-associated phospholipid phosphatase